MSVRALTWSFSLQLPDIPNKMAAKGVLNALADHADENGRSWPSAARLALFTGCDEKTARRALKTLIELGLVDRQSRPGKSDVFILQMNRENPVGVSVDESTPGITTTPMAPDHPGHGDPNPGHSARRTFMNRQGTVNTRAREAAEDQQSRIHLPDTAMWAERLANHRPQLGKRNWRAQWGPSPDSAGHNPLIPANLYREWRDAYDREMQAVRSGRQHEARQGSVAAHDAKVADSLAGPSSAAGASNSTRDTHLGYREFDASIRHA